MYMCMSICTSYKFFHIYHTFCIYTHSSTECILVFKVLHCVLLAHFSPCVSHTPCRPFTSNAAAQCIYFFKCCYFILSALQIVAGYPNRILGYFLGSKYTTVSGLAFQVYRVIPILSELREVMDWMFTDTVLNLLHWFRVQEIYAQVYLVKVRREREQVSLGDSSVLKVQK